MPTDLLLLYCTCPDRECAERIAREAVAGRLAACANIGGPSTSVYRWEGALETASEYTLAIKTSEPCYRALESLIVGLHPYELPEIIAVPLVRGLPGYLEWVKQCTDRETEER